MSPGMFNHLLCYMGRTGIRAASALIGSDGACYRAPTGGGGTSSPTPQHPVSAARMASLIAQHGGASRPQTGLHQAAANHVQACPAPVFHERQPPVAEIGLVVTGDLCREPSLGRTGMVQHLERPAGQVSAMGERPGQRHCFVHPASQPTPTAVAAANMVQMMAQAIVAAMAHPMHGAAN